MAVVTVSSPALRFGDYATLAIGIAAAVLLIRYNVNSAWLLSGGTILGLVLRTVGI
jgi:hypothetical protein